MSPNTSNRRKRRTTETPRSRDRAATERRIIDAVEQVLARDGFASLGVNEIARQAGVDKVLIYRYFGGLPELLRAFGERGNFWPTIEELFPDLEILRGKPQNELLTAFLMRLIDALRKRALTIEILAMEIDTPNALSQVLDEVREEWGMRIAQVLGGDDHPNAFELNVTVNLIVAGILHLMVRARRTEEWGGIPIQEERGWDAIKYGITWLVPRMLTNGETSHEE